MEMKTEFIANVMIILGILFSCISDMVINLDIADIDIKCHRRDLIGKLFIFLAVDFYLAKFKYTLFFSMHFILCIVDVIDVYVLWKQMKSYFITKMIIPNVFEGMG